MIEPFVTLARARPFCTLGIVHALPFLRAEALYSDSLHACAILDVISVLALAQPAGTARAFGVQNALSKRLARSAGWNFRKARTLVREVADLALASSFRQRAVRVVHALVECCARGARLFLLVAFTLLFVKSFLALADPSVGRGALRILDALTAEGTRLRSRDDWLALEALSVHTRQALAPSSVWRTTLSIISTLASFQARLSRSLERDAPFVVIKVTSSTLAPLCRRAGVVPLTDGVVHASVAICARLAWRDQGRALLSVRVKALHALAQAADRGRALRIYYALAKSAA